MDTKHKYVHIVYAVPAQKYFFAQLNRIFVRLKFPPLYRFFFRTTLIWENPINSPFSITYNLIKTFDQSDYKIKLYSLLEKGEITLGKDDLFIGHAWPDFSTKDPHTNSWSVYDAAQITNRTVLKYPNDKRIFLIAPFNMDEKQVAWSFPLTSVVENFIGVCGDYWYRAFKASEFTKHYKKFHQLNMYIETLDYPQLKKAFNEKGKRKFLYIGRISKEKNIDQLEKIAEADPSFMGGVIGGHIKGWETVATHAVLSPDYMRSILKEYDFFLSLSSFDAQATTVLEAMSWGMVVASTKESGYEEDSIIEMKIEDLAYNLDKINFLQNAEEKELKAIVDKNQILLSEKYGWNVFRSKLKNILQV